MKPYIWGSGILHVYWYYAQLGNDVYIHYVTINGRY